MKIKLTGARWVTDATISGTAKWNLSHRLRDGSADRDRGRARPVRYGELAGLRETGQLAVISGSQGSQRIAAVCPAP